MGTSQTKTKWPGTRILPSQSPVASTFVGCAQQALVARMGTWFKICQDSPNLNQGIEC